MLTAYCAIAVWFWLADLVAGRVAKSPCRPVAALFFAAVWPISMPLALIASAALVRGLRDKAFGVKA